MGKFFYYITATLLSFVSFFFSIAGFIGSIFSPKSPPIKQAQNEKWVDDDPVSLKHAA